MTPRLLPALILALASLPAQAQVYKWVDANGQVNYSNAAPQAAAGKTQVVEEKISISGLDPAVRAYADRRFAERSRQDEADWQLRQKAMSAQAAVPTYEGEYGGDYYPTYAGGFYTGYGYARRPFRNRPGNALPPRVSHHSAARPAFRASAPDLRR